MTQRKRKGPPPAELKLKSDLDRARREIARLKKDEPARGDEPGESAAFDRLRARVAELERSQSRLSKLYFTQLDERRRLAARLQKVLRAVGEIPLDLPLQALLERIAANIQSCLGFRTVLVRLREADPDRFEAVAFAGLAGPARAALEARPIAVQDVLSWQRDEFRVSRSYLIGHRHPFSRELPPGHVPDLGPRETWEWHAEDVLVTPLVGAGGELVGYFSVDDPEDRLVPSQETIELVEVFASHAVSAIEVARARDAQAAATPPESVAEPDMEHFKRQFDVVSHELRTPLTVIQAYTETLLFNGVRSASPEVLEKFLQVVDEESRRLARMVESILDLNRFDSGNPQARRQATDLAEIVDESLWLLGGMALSRDVELKVAREVADTRLDADRDQLRQLVLHLGSNAIKFTEAGGRVTLRLAGDQENVVLEVEDTGVGIPEDSLEKIFDRFYQVDASLSRRFGGGGLGLSISKSIVEWHGGALTVRSRPGEGSTFTAILPRRVCRKVRVRPTSDLSPATQEVLRRAVETVGEVMDARVVSLMALEAEGSLRVEAATGLEEAILSEARVRPGVGVSGWVAQHRRPLCVAHRGVAEIEGSGRSRYVTGTFLSVPVEDDAGLRGVLNVTDPASRRPFQVGDCHLLLELAEAIAHAWRASVSDEALEDGGAAAAEKMSLMLDHVRAGRRRTPERVRLARMLAEELSLTPSEAAMVGFAAALQAPRGRHGELALERLETLGAETFDRLDTMGAVRELVLSCGEWWDGSGQPRGLARTEIPLGSRVLAALDAFEAHTEEASFPVRARELAMADIRRQAGTRFDPDVVEALARVLPRLDAGEDAEAGLSTANEGR